MFGSISEWYYKSLLGINARAPGFTQFEIRPQPAGDLTWARGYYDAVVGKIVSDWHTDGTKFYLKVTIPANTKAIVYVPSLADFPVMENGHAAGSSEGLKLIEYRDGYAVFETDPGNYSFSSTWQ
jgi:alpha-L-rhamnosidase